MPKLELNLRRLTLKENVQFSLGTINDKADFTTLADTDQRQIDADLAKFKVERISNSFISKDGKYVITFAKDSENKMKRIVFYYREGETKSFADDVLDVNPDEIKTSKGSIKLGESSF